MSSTRDRPALVGPVVMFVYWGELDERISDAVQDQADSVLRPCDMADVLRQNATSKIC